MTIELTPRIMSNITREINHGRAIWAMLTANEYIGQGEVLHRVLANRAKKALSGDNCRGFSRRLIKQILEGKTLAELNEADRLKIRSNLKSAPPRQRKYVFKAPQQDFLYQAKHAERLLSRKS